ncbi:MAG: alpha/beta fold hydrolase, partial [Thermoleophilaceae bacterium]|nr:alpha/beta fold hydrolase [Thermoleophilaceae bacterium]
VMLPKGRPPKHGWPVVSWAHGTTGIADSCAPSRDPGGPYTAYAAAQFGAWLDSGYAIAFTDYEGLGTPGVHPYLVGRSEGRSVVDAIRATRQLDRRVGRLYVTAGHSQGGHAALFAAAVGPRWAPELKLRGVASFAPASHLGLLARVMTTLTTPSRLSGLSALMLRGMATTYPRVDLKKLVSDRARALFPQVDRRCVRELYASELFGGLPPSEMLRPGADVTAFTKALDAQNPNLKIAAPVLLLQGLTDPLTQPFMSDLLAAELRASGNRLTYLTYPGVEHIGIVGAADARTRKFFAARLR